MHLDKLHFRLLRTEVKREELEELSRLSEEKVEKDKEKLERMMQCGQSAMCRWRLLHEYFGEEMEAQKRKLVLLIFLRFLCLFVAVLFGKDLSRPTFEAKRYL